MTIVIDDEARNRIRALASALAPAMTPQAVEDVEAYIEADEWSLALSDLGEIAILEAAFVHRPEVAALAQDLGIPLRRIAGATG